MVTQCAFFFFGFTRLNRHMGTWSTRWGGGATFTFGVSCMILKRVVWGEFYVGRAVRNSLELPVNVTIEEWCNALIASLPMMFIFRACSNLFSPNWLGMIPKYKLVLEASAKS